MTGARIGRVYALLDPRDGAVRYVGKTVLTIEVRRDQHVHYAVRTKVPGNSHCSHWIRRLNTLGLVPGVRLLEEIPANGARTLNEAERWWIRQMKKNGMALCNQTEGGDGGATTTGRTVSAEARARISAANKKAANPERARKIAESKRRQWQDPEYRARMTEVGRKGGAATAAKTRGKPGRAWDEATRAKITAGKQASPYVASEETRAKISAALRGTGKTHPPGWADKVRATRAANRAARGEISE